MGKLSDRHLVITRRDVLEGVAAGLSLAAIPAMARAQPVTTTSPKQRPAGDYAADAPISIEVNARPLASFDTRDRSHVRFGALEFRSGLILTSPFRGFGGLSALRLDKAGERFVAISDKATWFTGRIVYDGRQMARLAGVEAAPMLGADGRPITARGWYDSESLALENGIAYVGLERVHQILKFDFGRDGLRAKGELLPTPAGLRKLPSNKGVESLVLVPKGQPLAGTLIAISERGLDADGHIIGFLIGGKTPGTFAVRRRDDFDISDATLLPSGELLLLERKFSLLNGVGIRVRRLDLTGLAPGAVIDGPSIFDADLGHEIDNMEGLDLHRDAAGDLVLTMVSDDNFSMIQRTLLLQFTLLDE